MCAEKLLLLVYDDSPLAIFPPHAPTPTPPDVHHFEPAAPIPPPFGAVGVVGESLSGLRFRQVLAPKYALTVIPPWWWDAGPASAWHPKELLLKRLPFVSRRL